ncbi:hypothetical protein RHGRI_019563 [Rhododendron griersonianum]|uniref:Uncharacterized protein n=2 Tax=Rhododendron TaxID=4346 RepID=A0AAV6JHC2_9ERIC
MLQLFFAVAFSAVPLTLYVPPIRSLNLFVGTMEELFRESSLYTGRFYPRLRALVPFSVVASVSILLGVFAKYVAGFCCEILWCFDAELSVCY